MNRNAKIGAAAAAIILVSGFVIYGLSQAPVSANPEFAQWEPTPAAIRKKIGTKESPAPGMTEAERRNRFCEMFKNRYRMHEPKVAVGVHFVTPSVLKLMCPARMEPCYIDQIALSLWHEARDNFGQPVDIEIYNTFIGANNIRIGTLKPLAENPEIARITYDYSILSRTPGPRMYRPIRFTPTRSMLEQMMRRRSRQASHRATL
jgi:hypothetical protein